jgi:hypothetical protein
LSSLFPRPARSDPIEQLPKRRLSLRATGEAAHLRPCRATPLEPMAIGPEWLPVGAFRPQLEQLAMLDHGDNLLDWCGSRSLIKHLSA